MTACRYDPSLLDPVSAMSGAGAPTLRQWLTRSVAVHGVLTNPAALRLVLARTVLSPTTDAAVAAARLMMEVRARARCSV